MAQDPIVRVQSHNPYGARFPGRRVVSREALLLMKLLRANGYKVTLEPDDGTEVNYLSRSGLLDFLSDPVVLLAVGVPISILCNLAASFIWDRLKGRRQDAGTDVMIELDEQGRKIRYTSQGKPLTDSELKSLLLAMERRAEFYRASMSQSGPTGRPYPVFVDHDGPLVGWAAAWMAQVGLMVEVTLTDEEARRRVQNGELVGFSVGGLVRRATCLRCGENFLECPHPTGEPQDTDAKVSIHEMEIAEISLVRDPAQPLAKIRIV